MKPHRLLILLLALTAIVTAADLTFNDAPQTTDSATILAQRTAVAVSTLASGGATAANQATANTSLATIATNTTSAQRTPTITTASGNGTVSAGARKLTFVFSTDFAGTVLGATFAGDDDASITIEAPANDTLAAVAYTVSAGSVRILKVQ